MSYQPACFDGVRALWEKVFPDDPPRNRAGVAIPAKLAVDELLWVALEGDAVIGSIMAGYDGHRGWLYAVAVSPDHRRGGIGTELVRHAETALAALGCAKVNLQVRATNAAVVRFYERLGYAVEERISMGKLI